MFEKLVGKRIWINTFDPETVGTADPRLEHEPGVTLLETHDIGIWVAGDGQFFQGQPCFLPWHRVESLGAAE